MNIQRLETNSASSVAPSETPPTVLTIAGSDSGGGAGIQADLKTFAAHDVHGASAITAVTAQNTVGVADVHLVPLDIVGSQIRVVVDDLAPVASKTGMLATAEIIELVASFSAASELPQLVVDPVMVATSGDRLLNTSAEDAYSEQLFPHAALITPNAVEAGVLCGRDLRSLADLHDAAKQLAQTGCRAVLVKGGHLDGDTSVDVFWDGSDASDLAAPRTVTRNTHGTGCSLAAAIAAGLAKGQTTLDAVVAAKAFVADGIAGATNWSLGRGHSPIDHFVKLR